MKERHFTKHCPWVEIPNEYLFFVMVSHQHLALAVSEEINMRPFLSLLKDVVFWFELECVYICDYILNYFRGIVEHSHF